ncbi:MAG: ParB/RepB/Spo0J family partition protein [Deltaproteobacteria bacterium]|nr:ParB/RepB/Spo0J family partition protein [Deltaproteobacteria bacterium]
MNTFACENTNIGMVTLIPIGDITVAPQVRTVFKDKSIKELAADIAKRGLLQPCVVRPTKDGFTLLIGERRYRAMKMLKCSHVPAIVAEVKDDAAKEHQLIENLQREDLSAKDLLQAVGELYAMHRSITKVAMVLNKSPAWVSKKVATLHGSGPLTLQLLESDCAKDQELLYSFSMLEKKAPDAAIDLLPKILTKEANRNEVKTALMKALNKTEIGSTDDDNVTTAPPSPTPTNANALETALTALRTIAATKAGSPAALAMVKTAQAALNQIEDATK